MIAAVGVLVVLAVLVWCGPPARRSLAGHGSGSGSALGRVVRRWRAAARGGGSGPGPAGLRAGWSGASGPGPADDLAGAVTTVCSQLRAGARPADAWARALGLPRCGPVPTVEALLGRPPTAVPSRRGRAPTAAEVGRARAVVAAATVAHHLGAPLTAVLEEVAAALAADAEAEAELTATLSGPRTTVRVLLGLPLLGVLLGTALGADPLGVLLDGRLGTLSGLTGCGLAAAGRWWTGALVARAQRAAS